MERVKNNKIIISIVIKATFCLIIAGAIFNALNMKSEQKPIERKINPNLQIIKENWKGNICIDGRYYNDSAVQKAPLLSVLKWKLSSNPQREEKKKDNFRLQTKVSDNLNSNEDKIVWFGHSSFYISINGIKILTDPCYYNLPTSKRKVPIPYDIASIDSIDYLLVSHNHPDHFQKLSVEEIVSCNPLITALVPLGANALFDGDLHNVKIQEAGWYQEYKLNNENIRIIFLPAKHWSRRGLSDFNKVLWGSFLIISNNIKIFFAGDSAYDDLIFKEIEEMFGGIDICIFPIGAYSPQFLMSEEHMTPEEAGEAYKAMAGKLFIPMHYGTYDLSDEPLGEPIRRLRKYFSDNNNNNNNSEHLVELTVGEEFVIK